jgi:hypothetical protein
VTAAALAPADIASVDMSPLPTQPAEITADDIATADRVLADGNSSIDDVRKAQWVKMQQFAAQPADTAPTGTNALPPTTPAENV